MCDVSGSPLNHFSPPKVCGSVHSCARGISGRQPVGNGLVAPSQHQYKAVPVSCTVCAMMYLKAMALAHKWDHSVGHRDAAKWFELNKHSVVNYKAM